MTEKTGHRQRLRDRFLKGNDDSRTDAALLELLLTYPIPQKDVRPLAERLLARFGSLDAVLGADLPSLCEVDGIKSQSATLLKVIECIRQRSTGRAHSAPGAEIPLPPPQPSLFDVPSEPEDRAHPMGDRQDATRTGVGDVQPSGEAEEHTTGLRRGTGLFAKAVLREAVELLPLLPETASLDEVREFLRSHLHFSGDQTRYRNANYIVQRMFPGGHADLALRRYAQVFAGRQELRDVCLYRFSSVQPLMRRVVEELILPSISSGTLERSRIRQYLRQQFPTAKENTVETCSRGVVDALIAGGIVRAERKALTFAYRRLLLPSLAFIVHSEFPEPGLHNLTALETNWALRCMLWSPEQILPALYELRNQGILARVSEIDTVRQFSTKWSLDEVVARLAEPGIRL